MTHVLIHAERSHDGSGQASLQAGLRLTINPNRLYSCTVDQRINATTIPHPSQLTIDKEIASISWKKSD